MAERAGWFSSDELLFFLQSVFHEKKVAISYFLQQYEGLAFSECDRNKEKQTANIILACLSKKREERKEAKE